MSQRKLIAVAVISVLAGLTACGGSGTSSGTTTTTKSSTKTVTGTITGFGSVFVNGVEYETTHASVQMDGTPATEQQLKVGMVVTLKGTVNADGKTGIASTVEFADLAQGLVLANNIPAGSATGTLNIMGQTVNVTASTVFASDVPAVTTPDGITTSDIVEVSGYSDGAGNIYATHLEVKGVYAAGDTLEVKGVVSGLDTAAKTFQVGNLVVDYSGVSTLPANLADGQYVEVQSTSAPTGTGPYTLVASQLGLTNNGDREATGQEGEDAQIQGVITDISGLPASFQINGQTVLISSESDNPVDTSGLAVGNSIEVEGQFNASGQLVIDHLTQGDEANLEIAANVDAVDPTAGTITVLGETFQVTNATMKMDTRDENSSTPVHYFSLSDIAVGDYVELQASVVNGQATATRLQRENDPATSVAKVQGVVDATAPALVVGGITIDTSAMAVPPAVTVGSHVEVTGTYSGSGTVIATTFQAD